MYAGLGQGDGVAIEGQVREVLLDADPDLVGQLGDTDATRPGDSLAGGDEETLDATGRLDEGLEDGYGDHGDTVGVCDDALGAIVDIVGIDLGHGEWNLEALTSYGGVVDDGRVGGHELGGVPAQGGDARGEHTSVDAGVVGRYGVFDSDILALEGQGLIRGARGREEPNHLNRETPLLQ